jgi:outer membrane protein assembly factor BamB
LLITVKDKPQLVVASSREVLAFDPASDTVLWSCKWGGNRYPALAYGSGLLYVCGDGGEGLAIDPAGEGDVSKTHVKWKHSKNPQGFATPVIVGDHIYRAAQPGVVRCWKLSDGSAVFEERLEKVPTYPSPIVTKDGRLYFASAGTSHVLKAGPKFEVLATNVLEEKLGEWTQSGPSPAVSGGRIYLRSPKTLYCIGKE